MVYLTLTRMISKPLDLAGVLALLWKEELNCAECGEGRNLYKASEKAVKETRRISEAILGTTQD